MIKRTQNIGQTTALVGDGINDAPALAQSDVGIAMGARGSEIAIEAAHIAKRTMRVVKSSILFTAIYNLTGLSLAAFGILLPVLAAALQSLPDLGILANSVRLI